MSPTMERVPANGVELEVAVEGSGETVVFVHGAGVADSYLPLTNDPAIRDHYRTIRYRRRGHAGSSPIDGVTPVSTHTDDCRALLAALGVDRAHIVGHSYGGAIALQLAVDAPELVATVAAFEPALVTVPSGPLFFEAAAPIFEMYNGGDRVAAVHAFLTAIGGPDWRSNIDRTVPGGVEQAEDDAATIFESDLPSIGAWDIGAEQAATITQPVLYVMGAGTHPLFPEGRDRLRAWLPRMEDVVVADAGHLLHIDRPGEVTAALADFLKRHPAGT